jgi:RNA polymerase sigma-32 factor
MLVFMIEAERTLVRAARRQPMLAREEERELARRARSGDREAASRLIGSHLRLIVKIAERYRAPGLATADLIQEGCIGLLQALQRFNPDHDARFATYSMWWIKSAIQDHVVRSWSLVRIGTSTAQKSLFFNIRRMRAALSETGETLSEAAVRRIARALGQPEREVRRMAERLAARERSLDERGRGDTAPLIERLVDHAPDPEQSLIFRDELRHRLKLLAGALAQLKDRERLIISRRYLSEVAETLDSLGRELGISKERVRQIEARAVAKLRALVLARLDDGATA